MTRKGSNVKAKKLTTPLTQGKALSLKAGDRVLLSGTVYTARDQAHKRMTETLIEGRDLTFIPPGATIYYAGPAPARPGRPIGSCGPTTSARMDAFAPALMAAGVRGMIGKGERGGNVVDAIKTFKGVYFAAAGGAGALLARRVKSARVVAYEDLGPEAVRELVVDDLPLIVAIDAHGNNLFERKKR